MNERTNERLNERNFISVGCVDTVKDCRLPYDPIISMCQSELISKLNDVFHSNLRYSKALSRSPSLKSSERLSLFGEDPAKGVTGPGQLRKGSLYLGNGKTIA